MLIFAGAGSRAFSDCILSVFALLLAAISVQLPDTTSFTHLSLPFYNTLMIIITSISSAVRIFKISN